MEILILFLFILGVYLFMMFGTVAIHSIILLIDFLITTVIVGLPGIIWSIVVILIMKFIYPSFKYNKIIRNNELSKIVTFKLKENKLIKDIKSETIRKKVSYWQPLLSYITIGVIILLIYYNFNDSLINTNFDIGFLSYSAGLGEGERQPEILFFMNFLEEVGSYFVPAMENWRSSPDFRITLSLSAIASTLLFLLFRPVKMMYKSLEAKIDRFSDGLKDTNLLLIDKIKEREKKMDKIADNLGCTINYQYIENIERFIENNNQKIVNNDSYLKEKVKEEKNKVEKDYKKLESCNNYYQETINLAEETARKVNRTGSRTLINEMDEILDGLESNNLIELVSYKKWSDFEEVLSDIRISLKQLKKGAEKYMSSDSSSDSFSKNKKRKTYSQKNKKKTKSQQYNKAYEKEISTENMDLENALNIIGLPEGSSKKEILEVASRKVKTWHPDRYGKTSRNISKEEWTKKYFLLKAARDFLKRYFK